METTKQLSKEVDSEKLGLIDFSGGDENLSPELIDDALGSTKTFLQKINLAEIAKRIRNNKAKFNGTKP
jgi:hypothetical protein